jgi:hypothetical protein
LWARISELVIAALRTFHAEMRILPPRGTESTVRLTWLMSRRTSACLP